MRIFSSTFLVAALLFANTAAANAPYSSIRPTPRPAGLGQTADQVTSNAQPAETALMTATALAILQSVRPEVRVVAAVAATDTPKASAKTKRVKDDRRGPRKGSVCGDRRIRGKAVARVTASNSACGIAKPVRITEIDGVKLSTPALMDCDTAEALTSWVRKGLKPAVGNKGGGVASLRVVAHYACRTRNSQPGAKISEHAKGRAIDIAGIGLENGKEISVLSGWKNRKEAKILKAAHKAACGPFGTVLGPEANAFHRDHFHFDTAEYRSGSYCK